MIGIFFGSTTGTTEELAGKIAERLNVAASDVHNVGETQADAVAPYDVLLLGTSTWGDGELQDDWYDFLDALKKQDLSGKKVGLFGCGDPSLIPILSVMEWDLSMRLLPVRVVPLWGPIRHGDIR